MVLQSNIVDFASFMSYAFANGRIDGDYVIFYERREVAAKSEQMKPVIDVESLVDGLKTLGLNAVTTDHVEAAVKASFPSGTEGQEESNILRTVFRFLKRSGAA